MQNCQFPISAQFPLIYPSGQWALNTKPVVQRHQMVSGSLALLLFIGLDLPLGSRAAALIGEKVL